MPVQFLALRLMAAAAYRLVGLTGLLGNSAVLWVLGSCAQRAPGSPSDTFVFSLALADLGLARTLPFWATESAMNFHWPFGSALCKIAALPSASTQAPSQSSTECRPVLGGG